MLNRAAIQQAIQQQMDACRGSDRGFAVIALRAGDMQHVALRFGSICGEEAETAVAGLISASLRPGDIVLQSGDETFLVVLPGLSNRGHVLLAATRLSATFERPHALAADIPLWQLRLAMGVAMYPRDADANEALWKNAQLALEAALHEGRPWVFHDASGLGPQVDYQELSHCISGNQLQTYFQPIWRLTQPAVAGIESLARWTSPTLGQISSDVFVPFAEQNNLIGALTRWSIHATLQQLGTLPDAERLRTSINLSPRALARSGAVEQLIDALGIWNIAASTLIIEVTETALADDLETIGVALFRLRDYGMRIAIDDFGVGHGSITYLSRFPITDIKIDKSLIGRIESDARTARLVNSIVQLAHSLDLVTTAEGIENERTQQVLTAMGCDYGQGYHLGRPMPAEHFATWLASRSDAASKPGPAS